MTRPVIAKIAEALKSVDSYSLEELTRYIVAQEMENQDRILDEDEIFDIATNVVEQEDVPIIEDVIDNNTAKLTNVEWNNVPDEMKVIDTDGDKSLLVNGKVHKVVIRESNKAEKIAERISNEIRASFNLFKADNGFEMDFDCYHVAAIGEYTCPECGSFNVNQVWFDDSGIVLNCADCGNEWESKSEVDNDDVAYATADEYEIVNDENTSIIGETYYDTEEHKFVFEIWADGEAIYADYVESFDDAITFFDTIKRFYEKMLKGVVLKDVNTGTSETIEDIEGSKVQTSMREAHIGNVAVELATGEKIADMSDIYLFDTVVDDFYRNEKGDTVEVHDIVDGEPIIVSSVWNDDKCDYDYNTYKMSKQELARYLDDGGYALNMR